MKRSLQIRLASFAFILALVPGTLTTRLLAATDENPEEPVTVESIVVLEPSEDSEPFVVAPTVRVDGNVMENGANHIFTEKATVEVSVDAENTYIFVEVNGVEVSYTGAFEVTETTTITARSKNTENQLISEAIVVTLTKEEAKAEDPKSEEPKDEDPNTEELKVEESKTEQPKTEEIKKETVNRQVKKVEPPVPPKPSVKNHGVQTGYENNFAQWAGILTVAAVVILYIVVKRRQLFHKK